MVMTMKRTTMINAPRKPERLLGVKVLIIAASLVGMIGGWAMLAVEQVRAMLATQPTAQTAPSFAPNPAAQTQSSLTQPPTTLRPVTGAPRPNARTRSSR